MGTACCIFAAPQGSPRKYLPRCFPTCGKEWSPKKLPASLALCEPGRHGWQVTFVQRDAHSLCSLKALCPEGPG